MQPLVEVPGDASDDAEVSAGAVAPLGLSRRSAARTALAASALAVLGLLTLVPLAQLGPGSLVGSRRPEETDGKVELAQIRAILGLDHVPGDADNASLASQIIDQGIPSDKKAHFAQVYFPRMVQVLPNYIHYEDLPGHDSSMKECVITNSEPCSMSGLDTNQFTLVGIDPTINPKVGCINSSHYYAFQVIPGDSKKLMVYFQGGGACWDRFSTTFEGVPNFGRGFCTQFIHEQSAVGVFDRTDAANPYRDFTVLHINYCSGDAHSGSITQEYKIKDGGVEHKVRQLGYHNTRAALDWLQGQNVMASTLDEFVVMGCSAGSLGAQIWSDTLLSEFASKKAWVVADSYGDIFPYNSQTDVIKSFGFCTTPLNSGVTVAPCADTTNNGTDDLNVGDAYMQAMQRHPTVPFIQLNSKYDVVQRIFYSLISISKLDLRSTIFGFFKVNYNKMLMRLLNKFNQKPNFLSFFVDGTDHCFTCRGEHGCGAGNWLQTYTTGLGKPGGASFAAYLQASSYQGQCAGQLVSMANWNPPTYQNRTWCDTTLTAKSFTP